jgi:hypothetical protein
VYWRGFAKTSEKFDIPISIWRMAFIKYFPIRVGLGIRPTAGIGTVRAVKTKMTSATDRELLYPFRDRWCFYGRTWPPKSVLSLLLNLGPHLVPRLGSPVGINAAGSSLILCHRPSTMSFESAEYPLAASPLGPTGHSSLQKKSDPWRGCASGEPDCNNFLPNCTGLEPSERRLPT